MGWDSCNMWPGQRSGSKQMVEMKRDSIGVRCLFVCLLLKIDVTASFVFMVFGRNDTGDICYPG